MQKSSLIASKKVSSMASKQISKVASRVQSQVASRITSRINSRMVSRRGSPPPVLTRRSSGDLFSGSKLKPNFGQPNFGKPRNSLLTGKLNIEPIKSATENSSTSSGPSSCSSDTYNETRDVFNGYPLFCSLVTSFLYPIKALLFKFHCLLIEFSCSKKIVFFRKTCRRALDQNCAAFVAFH